MSATLTIRNAKGKKTLLKSASPAEIAEQVKITLTELAGNTDGEEVEYQIVFVPVVTIKSLKSAIGA